MYNLVKYRPELPKMYYEKDKIKKSYESKLIIKVRFNGEISFDTNDKETTFFIKIPVIEEE